MSPVLCSHTSLKSENPEDFSILKLSLDVSSEYLARGGFVSYYDRCTPLTESFNILLPTSKKQNSCWLDLSIVTFLASIALLKWMFIWICFPVFYRPYSKNSLLNPTQVKDQPGWNASVIIHSVKNNILVIKLCISTTCKTIHFKSLV